MALLCCGVCVHMVFTGQMTPQAKRAMMMQMMMSVGKKERKEAGRKGGEEGGGSLFGVGLG